MFYVVIMDSWSNLSYVGPFESRQSAEAYKETVNPVFDRNVLTQKAFDDAVEEFGPAKIEAP